MASERENIRDTLLRAWMPFQWARRDYINFSKGEYYNPHRQDEAYTKLMNAWNVWVGVLIEQFGHGYLVEYEHRTELDLITEVKTALVQGIIFLPEF